MVVFLNDLPSERAIRPAALIRCRSVFGNTKLNEKTPEHSSLRDSPAVGSESMTSAFHVTCRLAGARAFARQASGIDSSVIEANASLRALVHRNTTD